MLHEMAALRSASDIPSFVRLSPNNSINVCPIMSSIFCFSSTLTHSCIASLTVLLCLMLLVHGYQGHRRGLCDILIVLDGSQRLIDESETTTMPANLHPHARWPCTVIQ